MILNSPFGHSKKNNIMNEVIVKTDGVEALDDYFGKN